MKLGLAILMNNVCDMNCSYCYEKNVGNEILTKENLKSILDRFNNSSFFNNDVEFFGGEPTLSLNVIKHIYELFPKIKYRIITNGYFLYLKEYEYDFLSNFQDIVVSLELSKEAYKKYRKRNDLDNKIERIIKLNNRWKNISINVSINYQIYKDIDEFISYVELFDKNSIPIHFYSLKSETEFDEKSYYDFLLLLKNKNKNIYNRIILNDKIESDIEYTCTMNDRITIDSNMKITECVWKKDKILDINSTDSEIMDFYINSIAQNHKSNFNGCKNCDVEIGKCSISCRAFFLEIEKKGNFELLERLCNFEKIKEYLRREM